MAYWIRGTRGLARFVSDLYVTIPAYPFRFGDQRQLRGMKTIPIAPGERRLSVQLSDFHRDAPQGARRAVSGRYLAPRAFKCGYRLRCAVG